MARFQPYAARNTTSLLFPHCIVAAESFEGYLVVYERPCVPEIGPLGLGVCVLWWHKSRVDGPRPSIIKDGNTPLQSVLARIKKSMLDHGAVAEAVVLIGALSPFSEKELKIMSDKLKTKPVTAAKEPKAKPAAAAKSKGNPEALKKAQDAAAGKRAEARLRKIKPLKKAKEIEARDGSFRKQMLTDILNAKTVGDFYDAGEKYDSGCLKFAVDNGYVSVG